MSAAPRLTAAVLGEIRRSVLCWLATVDADGMPNVSPKEVFCADGEEAILIADRRPFVAALIQIDCGAGAGRATTR